MKRLNLATKFNYNMIRCCQFREIFIIYRPNISFNENYQPVQGWNPATTIKTETLKMRFND